MGKEWGIEAKYGEQDRDSRQDNGGMTRSEDRKYI